MQLDPKTMLDKSRNAVVQAERISIKTIVESHQHLQKNKSNLSDDIEGIMAIHLNIVAGAVSHASETGYQPVYEPLKEIYDLKLWEYDNFFIREALFNVVGPTTLDPPSFETLLHLIPASLASLERSKKRGSISFPQEEQNLKNLQHRAWEYLHFSSEGEIPEKGFREILERWENHPHPLIRKLIYAIQQDFLTHQ